jgi:hypothetical protein
VPTRRRSSRAPRRQRAQRRRVSHCTARPWPQGHGRTWRLWWRPQ